jgi:hypothetical protein
MGPDMASSHTMVVNTIGQLAGGITFAYELQLMHSLRCWKGLRVFNIVKGLGTSYENYNPKKLHLIPQNGSQRFWTTIFQTRTCH